MQVIGSGREPRWQLVQNACTWDNLYAHDVELQVCGQLLESVMGAGNSCFQSALDYGTESFISHYLRPGFGSAKYRKD